MTRQYACGLDAEDTGPVIKKPLIFPVLSKRAQTSSRSEIGEFVITFSCPTENSPLLRGVFLSHALHWSRIWAIDWVLSSPKHPKSFPLASSVGIYPSVPVSKLIDPVIISELWTDMPDRYPLSTRSTSFVIKPDATVLAPAQPYPSIDAPKGPISPISWRIFLS